ncbi:PREDICTED: protein misato homolog 1 isoform X2 [Tarenaya hassleriana]|uniref:protein misato homolog 1 isoform X2 n=1 Tax=Tarenaya hassleriana TaxID=28532 RepID=UPI00053C5F80|nr:PREDICTED: protein misato homolog 1 isoform X2 [Tarenaya hassleriana]
MREIVTVQVGGFANFVGSHFWNFQDELLGLADDPESDPIFKNQRLNMDVLYRAGETQMGVATYTPRVVSVNFQGSLGSMSSSGTIYSEKISARSNISTWFGNVTTHASEPRKKNLFLESLYEEEQDKVRGRENDNMSESQDKDIVECLDKGVEYWTDFSKVHYHPQSLYELSGLWMDSQDFNNYGIGRDIFSEGSRGEELSERLRFFVEECDHIQGIQFLVDDSGGFSALAADFLENIADDYTNIPLLLYSVRSPSLHTNTRSSKRSISGKASKYLLLQDEKLYHSSAVYAAALHSSIIPFRMEPLSSALDSSEVSGAMDVNTLVQMLSGRDRQNIVAILDAAIPSPALSGKQSENTLVMDLQPLTPEVAEDVEDTRAIESMSLLGAIGSEGIEASISEAKDAVHASYEQNTSVRPLFCNVSVSRCPLPVPLPFPRIFGNLIGRKGEILGSPLSDSLPRGPLDVHSVPLATRLRSSSAILPFLERRMGNLQKYGIQWGAVGSDLVRTWGFGREELQEMRENLSKMVAELNPQLLESSDSD